MPEDPLRTTAVAGQPLPPLRTAVAGEGAPGEEEDLPPTATSDDLTWQITPRLVSPLPERYEEVALIGAGASGEVRRVLDRHLNRTLAMKLLRFEHLLDDRIRGRFLAEAELTAGLQHPGIIAVHDRGELPDGRLWFTMQEVRGRTLGAVIHEIHKHKSGLGFEPTPSGWTFRRAVDAVARAAQAVGYAHRMGVVHRDLKPENLMVGELGEVLVMDWGLARRRPDAKQDVTAQAAATADADVPSSDPPERRFAMDGTRTQDGDILGTPAYMSPEQALGLRSLHGPASDVYSLGAILYHLLAGTHPYAGTGMHLFRRVQAGAPSPVAEVARGGPPLPPELVTICERAMQRDIAARYPDASAMADDLVAFLDGARRREQALAIVEKARAAEPIMAALREKKAEMEADARRLLEAVKPFDPVERKAAAWELQDEASRLGREAALRETEWLEGMHGALSVEPALPEARDALAAYYGDRLLEAERASRVEEAIRFEALLRAHDRGPFASMLRGEGALSLVTDPPGARVTLYRYVEERRRLVPTLVEEIGPTPILKRTLQRGSYLCVIRAEGRAEVRYPVSIERGGHWDGVPPGDSEPFAIPLPREGELGEGEVYVPAGWCWIGGDAQAGDNLPARRIWIDGFAIGRFPVTSGEYVDFLNGFVEAARVAEAMAMCPRRQLGLVESGEARPVFARDVNGRFVLPGDWASDWPMVLVDWHVASAYCRVAAERAQRAFRLPNELEREKAARGVDGRPFPWGAHPDATFACASESHMGTPGRVVVGSYAADESPYGARDLAGNVRDWCVNSWRPEGPLVERDRLLVDAASPADREFRVIRGGMWGSALVNSRSAARFGGRPQTSFLAVGLRMARSWP